MVKKAYIFKAQDNQEVVHTLEGVSGYIIKQLSWFRLVYSSGNESDTYYFNQDAKNILEKQFKTDIK